MVNDRSDRERRIERSDALGGHPTAVDVPLALAEDPGTDFVQRRPPRLDGAESAAGLEHAPDLRERLLGRRVVDRPAGVDPAEAAVRKGQLLAYGDYDAE